MEEEEHLLVLRVRVANRGQAESGYCGVHAELLRLEQGDMVSLPPLAPGQSEDVYINLEFPRELRGEWFEISIHADYGQRVEEEDEENNVEELESITDPLEGTPEPVVVRGQDDGDGPDLGWPLIIAAAAVLTLALGGIGYGLLRFLRGRPGPKPKGEPQKPRPPVLPFPPVRLLRIWLSEGITGKGNVLHDRHSLQAGSTYTLHLQVQPRGSQSEHASGPRRGSRMRQLRVLLFSPESDFRFSTEKSS